MVHVSRCIVSGAGEQCVRCDIVDESAAVCMRRHSAASSTDYNADDYNAETDHDIGDTEASGYANDAESDLCSRRHDETERYDNSRQHADKL